MKVYLAGRVTRNGWRTRLVGGAELDAARLADDEPWPVLKGAIFGQHDYVGPFLYGCDHGCFHGPNSHGMLALQGACVSEGHFNPGIDPEEIIRRCFESIQRADLVFGWIEQPEDYGSMVEIGYALGIGKLVIVGASNHAAEVYEDHWFATTAAVDCAYADTPERALEEAFAFIENCPDRLIPRHVPSVDGIPMSVFSWCESPIESRLLTGFVNAAKLRGLGLDVMGTSVVPGRVKFSLSPQVSVAGHRVDFVMSRNGTKAVVECDGHDYHERTKEQAKHDRSADRAYQAAGYRVLRFTGSEIYRGAEKCAVEVYSQLMEDA